MMGHDDTLKLLIEVGQADINTKDNVSHSNCITRYIIRPNYVQLSNSNYLI